MNIFEVKRHVIEEMMDVMSLHHYDPKPIEALGLKLFEEAGEVAEAINVNQGHLKKTLTEPIENEIADCINCLMTILGRSYPGNSVYKNLALLAKAMKTKNNKYRSILGYIDRE